MSCAPQCATGITGAPVVRASRAAPVLPTIGHRSGSRVAVPSGYTITESSFRSACSACWSTRPASPRPRYTGSCPNFDSSDPITLTSKMPDLIMNTGYRCA